MTRVVQFSASAGWVQWGEIDGDRIMTLANASGQTVSSVNAATVKILQEIEVADPPLPWTDEELAVADFLSERYYTRPLDEVAEDVRLHYLTRARELVAVARQARKDKKTEAMTFTEEQIRMAIAVAIFIIAPLVILVKCLTNHEDDDK